MINTGLSTVTSIAHIVVWANFTAPALTTFNIEVTCVTCCDKGRSSWVVQMIKHHHGRMFCPPQCIILIMVPLTKTQECLPCIEKFTFKYLVSILCVCGNISDLNLQIRKAPSREIQKNTETLKERTSSQISKVANATYRIQIMFILLINRMPFPVFSFLFRLIAPERLNNVLETAALYQV